MNNIVFSQNHWEFYILWKKYAELYIYDIPTIMKSQIIVCRHMGRVKIAFYEQYAL